MIRAIVVDDEPATGNIIEYFIKNEMLPIEISGKANSGAEALSMIKKYKPALVFLDIKMPFMDGFEVMEKSKELTSEDIIFIIITGYDLFEYAQSALRHGASDILLKPIDLSQLKKAVIKAIGYDYTSNNTVNSVLAHIHGHYTEDITLNSVASDLFLSPQYLAKIFKKHTNTTFNKYLNKVRIDRAKYLLLHSNYSIKEISEKVGYMNINNFYSQFKTHTGISPKQYIENNKLSNF